MTIGAQHFRFIQCHLLTNLYAPSMCEFVCKSICVNPAQQQQQQWRLAQLRTVLIIEQNLAWNCYEKISASSWHVDVVVCAADVELVILRTLKCSNRSPLAFNQTTTTTTFFRWLDLHALQAGDELTKLSFWLQFWAHYFHSEAHWDTRSSLGNHFPVSIRVFSLFLLCSALLHLLLILLVPSWPNNLLALHHHRRSYLFRTLDFNGKKSNLAKFWVSSSFSTLT